MEREPNSEGMLPVNPLLPRSSSERLEREPNSEGMPSVSELLLRCNFSKRVRDFN